MSYDNNNNKPNALIKKNLKVSRERKKLNHTQRAAFENLEKSHSHRKKKRRRRVSIDSEARTGGNRLLGIVRIILRYTADLSRARNKPSDAVVVIGLILSLLLGGRNFVLNWIRTFFNARFKQLEWANVESKRHSILKLGEIQAGFINFEAGVFNEIFIF